ncbi:MAG TPA: YoaK family protein [Candidatus Acidoferrum sp.]|nr:YoaK family protein [Candidatus Acidoferrum sp.]
MNNFGTTSRATVLLFTWAAGSVDAIAYLAGHVFTANMTGNAVLLGVSTGELKSTAAARALLALVAFIAGVVLGALLVREGGLAKASADVRRAVIVEAIILAIFAAVAMLPLPLGEGARVNLLIGVSGFGMGLQSAVVRRLNVPGIATTYITGTITSLFSGLVHHWDVLKGGDSGEAEAGPPSEKKRSLALQAEVFISYALSALVTAALHAQWPSGVALLPFGAIAMVAVFLSVRKSVQVVTT